MALLGTFINAGLACLALGANCFAHSLPTTPDFVIFTLATNGGANVSLPNLVSRGSAGAYTSAPFETKAEGLFASFHSIIR